MCSYEKTGGGAIFKQCTRLMTSANCTLCDDMTFELTLNIICTCMLLKACIYLIHPSRSFVAVLDLVPAHPKIVPPRRPWLAHTVQLEGK